MSNTNLNFMKENIIKELSSYFDLSNINWSNVWLSSQNSLKIDAWKLHKEGYKNVEIAKIIKVSTGCVSVYLRDMRELYGE